AVEGDALGREVRREGDGQLTARTHVQAEALLLDPAGDLGAQERLARVVDLAVAERAGEVAAAGPEVVLVVDVQRRAVLLGQVAYVHATDHQGLVVPARTARPDAGRERVEVAWRRQRMVFRQHVRVPGTGRVDSTHALSVVSFGAFTGGRPESPRA